MTLITYTAPSGRAGTYETAGGDLERITALTRLMALSLTKDASSEEHLDNLYQSAVCLKAELEDLMAHGPMVISHTEKRENWHLADALVDGLAEFVDGGSA